MIERIAPSDPRADGTDLSLATILATVRVTDRKGRAKLRAPKRGGGLKVSATTEGYRKAAKFVRVR